MIEQMKEKVQVGDKFVLKEENEKGTTKYIKASVRQKYPYVVMMVRKDRRGKEHKITWSWAKLAVRGTMIGSR